MIDNKDKIRILMLGDSILSNSGVGTQGKIIADALLRSGKFQIIQLAGAIKHSRYDAMTIEEFKDDLIILPVNGFGTPEQIRGALRTHKIDIVYYISDPRFYGWFYEISNEIRELVPIVYNHVWDNVPEPKYNKQYYLSNDKIVSISKVTSECVKKVSPEVEEEYLPHAVDDSIFKKLPEEEIQKFKKEFLGVNDDVMLFNYVSRNARRKNIGSIVVWFKDFLDIVGHDKAKLIMHTDPRDPEHGIPLDVLTRDFGLDKGQILISSKKVSQQELAKVYNAADWTINCSDNEGFGMSAQESLACETPIIVTMTGGLQEQIYDGKKYLGIPIKPASCSIIGSELTPYINEDRISKEDYVNALLKAYNMPKEKRIKLGKLCKAHVNKNYNYKRYCSRWVEIMLEIHEKYGSWNTRRGYVPYTQINL